mmetsp:Transcript_6146/g.10437  ORF Transcript_6146/g.10437 Transcript_6146/m.10437 type:complete len:150 (+) Transcript_6146:188-637(+)
MMSLGTREEDQPYNIVLIQQTFYGDRNPQFIFEVRKYVQEASGYMGNPFLHTLKIYTKMKYQQAKNALKSYYSFLEGIFRQASPSQVVVQEVEIRTNYIDEVVCYSSGTVTFNASKGDPLAHNHIQRVVIYKGAKVNRVDFSDEIESHF